MKSRDDDECMGAVAMGKRAEQSRAEREESRNLKGEREREKGKRLENFDFSRTVRCSRSFCTILFFFFLFFSTTEYKR